MLRRGSAWPKLMGLSIVFGVVLARLIHNTAVGLGTGVAIGVALIVIDRFLGRRGYSKVPPAS